MREMNIIIALYRWFKCLSHSQKMPNQNILHMQELICKLCEWLWANKLTLNLDISNFSLFHPPRKKITDEFYSLNVGGGNY